MAPQREWFEKDYYKELGVPASVTDKDVTKAYRTLAKQFHPDANPGDTVAEDRFKAISAAYEVLSNAEKRKEYDEVRRMVASGVGPGRLGGGGGFAGFGAGPRGATHIRFEDLDDDASFSDLFSQLFTSGGPGGRGRTSPRKGRDLETAVHLDFLEAAHGVQTTVRYPAQGEVREVTVRVPAGVDDGQRIRVASRGLDGTNGGPPGDLYVQVEVRPHRIFGREGNNLTLTVPVTYPEAALGAEIRIPTLDEPVTIKVPAGTPSGKLMRVRGRGIAKASGAKGDLLLTIEVAVPRHPNSDEKKALEKLAAAIKESPRAHFETT